jgi:hypothetical protein
MAFRNQKPTVIGDWKGLNSFDDAENLPPDVWFESKNVIVSATGSAVALRSPANYNDATAHSNPVLSAFDYDRSAGNLLIYDIDIGGGGDTVRTYSTAGSTNTTERSGQADGKRWQSVMVNDNAYRLNGAEFVQMVTDTSFYKVGITPPASAPSVSYVSGGSGSIVAGLTVSYAYRNSVTGHVSAPSAASNDPGVTSGDLTLRVPVTASAETGVDGIVIFVTQDGGSIRYLYIDTSGDPVVSSNASANIDVSVALLSNLDTLTEEPVFNTVPPTTAYFMFRWKDRIMLCDFRDSATSRQSIRYSGYEAVSYGVPWETYPALNIINISNKGEAVRCGIETDIGALVLSEEDGYLIRGFPTDKQSSPANTISITEQLQQLNWAVGTRSPLTLVATPYGPIWLDQNKRIQMFPKGSASPVEIGLPLRTELKDILDTAAARNMAQGVWFQHGEAGGYYVLTASTTGSTNNELFIITVYQDPNTGGMVQACAHAPDIAVQCLLVAEVSGKKRLFGGVTDRLRELLALDTAGAGWASGTDLYFSMTIGNGGGFNHVHSLSFDALNGNEISVWVSEDNGTDLRSLDLERVNGSYQALIDAYGRSKRIRFVFPEDDTTRKEVRNLRVMTSAKSRAL